MGKHRSRVMTVVGARPNMMKAAPLITEMSRSEELDPLLVHTGQHYDHAMSDVFFEQLHMPVPKYHLAVGPGNQHFQTGEIIKRFGELLERDCPDMVVVVGDVNSTMACALVAVKERIPLAHVEAGLRSFDRTMPEEVNRVVTDAVADLLFTTEESARANLQREGVPSEKIFFVGNVMIDSLARAIELARHSEVVARLGLPRRGYVVLTLHRPSNVDHPERLRAVLGGVAEIARQIPVLFPVHPRTAKRIAEASIDGMRSWAGLEAIAGPGVWTMPPTPYIDFLGLMDGAALAITDSGGIQEETTFLGVPCLTFRENTERPITVARGTNRVIGTDPRVLVHEARALLEQGQMQGKSSHCESLPLWDGHASERIVRILLQHLQERQSLGETRWIR